MYPGILIVTIIAGVIFYLAFQIGKGHTNLIHDYHVRNIKEKDMPKYAKLISKGLYVIGLGSLLSGGFMYLESVVGVLTSIFAGLLIGIVMIANAQKRFKK